MVFYRKYNFECEWWCDLWKKYYVDNSNSEKYKGFFFNTYIKYKYNDEIDKINLPYKKLQFSVTYWEMVAYT